MLSRGALIVRHKEIGLVKRIYGRLSAPVAFQGHDTTRPERLPRLGAYPARAQWPAELGLDQTVAHCRDSATAIGLAVNEDLADTTTVDPQHSACHEDVAGEHVVAPSPNGVRVK